MKKIIYLFFILSFCACKSVKTTSSKDGETLFYIEEWAIPKSEFIYVYNKNKFLNDSLSTKESIKKYLDIYINFKLKVKEAQFLGLDTTQSFIKEFEGYKEQLAQPYLTVNTVVERMVKEAYEHLKQDVNASHILILVNSEASPNDTLEAYNKIIDIRKKALNGENFESLAKEFSEDPSAQYNGGNLGYFTGMQMVYPFEKAVYNTAVGKISDPVRTRFGYHIVKVIDKRPSKGQVRVSHIMIRASEGLDKHDSIETKNKALSIYQQLKNGANWDTLCLKYSDDIDTRNKSGQLPWIGVGARLPSEFIEAALSIDSVGDIISPIKTPLGWHIIRLDERKPLLPYETLAPSLKLKVTKASRGQISTEALLEKLKKENKYIDFPNNVEETLKHYKDRKTWLDSAGDQKKLFIISGEKHLATEFYNFVEIQLKNTSPSPEELKALYQNFVTNVIIEDEKSQLEKKYPEYALLVNEYREGILLFNIMNEKVWTKAVVDTVGLNEFYEKHKKQYPQDKTLKEIKGLVIADYQVALENEWLSLLKKKYNVIINEEILEETIKKIEKTSK